MHYQKAMGSHLANLRHLLPGPKDYAELPRSWSKDLLAGVTVGVVALPLALGFGVASGVGAAPGLVTAVVAGIVAAVFGGSHLQVTGPTGAMTVVLLPVIAEYGVEMVPLLAVMAGVMIVVMGLFGAGKAVDIIPWPVVEGFTMGIGVIILLQQLPLALDAPKGDSESSLISTWQTVTMTDWSKAVAPLALVGLVVVIHQVGRRFRESWPWALISVIIVTLVAELASIPVERIGELPAGLPAPSMPGWTPALLMKLLAPAFAVAALGALESLLAARVSDGMAPDVPRTQPDRELIGQGLANVASGLFGGLPATGAIARTAVNVRAGAKTRVASIVHALFLVLVMLVLAPLVSRIPLAALGGVLVMTAMRMVNIPLARKISGTTPADRNIFFATFAATVLLDLVVAVLAGVAMAAMMSLRHMATYTVLRRQNLPADTHEGVIDYTRDEEHLRDKVLIYRVDGALFYGNARRFIDQITTKGEGVEAIILRCHRMQFFDASGAEGLAEAHAAFKRADIPLIVQGMTPDQVRVASSVDPSIAEVHVTELSEAVARVAELVGPDDVPQPDTSAPTKSPFAPRGD